MNTDFFNEFKPQTKKDWEERLRKDLKGENPVQKLLWESIEGIKIPAYFHQVDGKTRTDTPGDAPYRRGGSHENNEWKIRDVFCFDGNEKRTRDKIIEALMGGVNHLEIHCSSLPNWSTLLEGVQLDIIESEFWLNSKTEKEDLMKWLHNHYDVKQLHVSILEDPISVALQNGEHIDADRVQSFTHSIADQKEFPFLGMLGVDASIVGFTGGDAVEELAYAIALTQEYLHALKEDGDIDELSKFFRVKLSIGRDLFMELAKFKAMRLLWSTLVKAHEAKASCTASLKINAVTNTFYYTENDKYNNILRATTGVFSAASGGADSIAVSPFDQYQSGSESFIRRISRNVQHILQQESYLNLVADPLGGSYLVEYLTDELVKKAWDLFLTIEEEGGLLMSLQKGTFQEKVSTTRSKRIQALNDEKESLLGVNHYQPEKCVEEQQLKQPEKNEIEPLPPLKWGAFYKK